MKKALMYKNKEWNTIQISENSIKAKECVSSFSEETNFEASLIINTLHTGTFYHVGQKYVCRK